MSTEYIYRCDVCNEIVESRDDLFPMGVKPTDFGDHTFALYRLPKLVEEDVCFDCQNAIQSFVDSLRIQPCKI